MSGSSRENGSSLPTPPHERRDLGFLLPPPQDPEPPRHTYRHAMALQWVGESPRHLAWDTRTEPGPPRMYETSTGQGQPVQRSYSILEPPSSIPTPLQERRDDLGFSLPHRAHVPSCGAVRPLLPYDKVSAPPPFFSPSSDDV